MKLRKRSNMNRINFTPTKFIDTRNGLETLGYRAYDDYGKAYANLWDSIPDDDMEFLRRILEEDRDEESVDAIFRYMLEYEEGCYVGDNYYEFDELKDL